MIAVKQYSDRRRIISYASSYNLMHNEFTIQPVFADLAIVRPIIMMKQPLVAISSHRLYLQKNSIPWQKRIVNCCYLPTQQVLLALCDDWKIYAFNKDLSLIARLSGWQSKYSVGFKYIPEIQSFLLIGVADIDLMQVVINTNILKTKFLSSVTFSIDKQAMRSASPAGRLQWHKGYNIDVSEDLLYVWSLQQINFYSLAKLQLKSSVLNLTKKELPITTVLFNRYYKYTITGLINGSIKIWRLPLNGYQESNHSLINHCQAHTKYIENIVPDTDIRTIISSSADMTICFWSLETFELLRVFRFTHAQYECLQLVNNLKAYALHNNSLGQFCFSNSLEYITELTSQIIHFDKAHRQQQIIQINLTLSSNLGMQLLCESFNCSDLNKMQLPYFYPPLKAKSIKQVVSCPYSDNQYYMLVESGQIYKMRIEQNASKIQQLLMIERAFDAEDHPLNESPTLIKFLPLLPMQFDTEINDNSIHNKQQGGQQDLDVLKIITIGCERGSIVFISLDRVDRIRTRLTYHRENIVAVETITTAKGDIMASLCIEHYLKFVQFQTGKPNCYLTLNCSQGLKQIKGFGNTLAMVLQQGQFELVRFQGYYDNWAYQDPKTADHEGEILSLDFQPQLQLVVTCATDNRIRVWTYYKLLVYEIKLDEGLQYSVWTNNFELFVAHQHKLFYLRTLPRHITKQDVELRNQSFLQKEAYSRLQLKQICSSLKEYARIFKPTYDLSEGYSKKVSPNCCNPRNSVSKRVSSVNQYHFDPTVVGAASLKSTFNIPRSTKCKSTKKKSISNYSAITKQQEQQRKKANREANLRATNQYIGELTNLRKTTHNSLLPKIQPRNQDKFEQFISAKLTSKKMLTRRDITLNRIIMKNLIREQLGTQHDNQAVNSLQLDF